MTNLIKNNYVLITGVAALISLITFIYYIIKYLQYIKQKTKELKQKRFEAYNDLIKDLVKPDKDVGHTWLDRQVAIAYELRNFPEYYEVTERILNAWVSDTSKLEKASRLSEEMQLTLEYIKNKRK